MGDLDLSGSVVIVTGGGKGVGLGITQRFLAAGADVVIGGRNEPEVAIAATRVSDGQSVEAVFLPCNVRDAEQVGALIDHTVARFGRLDVLVNNAGGAPHVAAADASPRFSASIIDLNLTAALHCSTAANAVMQGQADGGAIINICSVSGTRPSPGTAAYGAAKAGLINLTQSLGVEWAPKVRVNAITAGLIRTEQAELHYGDQAGIDRVSATVPMGRMGQPSDVGDACLFLASSMSSYITGANLELHGGGEWPAFLRAAAGESA